VNSSVFSRCMKDASEDNDVRDAGKLFRVFFPQTLLDVNPLSFMLPLISFALPWCPPTLLVQVVPHFHTPRVQSTCMFKTCAICDYS